MDDVQCIIYNVKHMCVTLTVDLSIIIVEGSFRGGLSDGRQYDRRSVSET